MLYKVSAVFCFISLAAFENLVQANELTRNFKRDVSASCLGDVKIRDGQSERSQGEPLKFSKSLHLSVVTGFDCGSKYKIHYHWKIYKSSSIEAIGAEYSVKAISNQSDFILQEHVLSTGRYVIKVLLTLRDAAAYDWLVAKKEMATLVEKKKTQAKVYIVGGNKISMGASSVKKFQLEAVSNVNEGNLPTYRWFCSTSNVNLPSVGSSTTRPSFDTCLTGRSTKWLLDGEQLTIVTSIMVSTERYHFRVIVTATDYLPGIADIEVLPTTQTVPLVRIRCKANCCNPTITVKPLILELYCPDCVETSWTLNSQPLKHTSKRFCKLNETFLGGLRPVIKHTITAKGIDTEGRKASASFYFYRATTPSGGSCYASVTSSTPSYDVICSGFKSSTSVALVYNFYSVKDGAETLLQHGYDKTLSDVTGSQDFVTYRVEVCDETPACVEERVSNLPGVKGPTLTVHEAVALFTATGDVARLLQAMTSWPTTSSVADIHFQKVITKLEAAGSPVVMETALQTLDVINYMLPLVDRNRQTQEQLWEILLGIVRFSDKKRDSRYIWNIATSGVKASASLLNLQSSDTDKLRGIALVMSYARLAMYSVIPGEKVTKFSEPNVDVYLKRATQDDEELVIPGLKIRQLKNTGLGSRLNFEVCSFHASRFDPISARRQMDEIKSVTVTSGDFPMLDPISSEALRKLPIIFSSSSKAVIDSDFPLAVTSTCDVTKCNSVAMATYSLNAEGYNNLGRGNLVILISETDKLITRALDMRLSENNLENEILGKTVRPGDDAKWSIPTVQLPSNISSLLLTVSTSLGAVYFRQGSVLKIKMRIYVMNCMSWNVAIGDWQSDKCKANDKLECECSSLSNSKLGEEYPFNISSTFLGVSLTNIKPIGRNIDIPSSSWWQDLMDNPVVLLVLLFLYSLYGLLFVWSKRKDRDVERKGYYHEPEDNCTMGSSVYYVTIYTGGRRYAGTTATVALTLIGTSNKSHVHIIQKSGERRFIRGSVVTLAIRTPYSLGDITAMRIWHNCEGKSPEWYLQRMVIREVDSNSRWFVVCDTWLGLVCDRIFTVATQRHLSAFRRLFRIKCDVYFRDRHTWYSILAMRPWDQRGMSRLERISNCMMTIFFVMLVAMVFHVDKVENENSTMSLAYYSFKWSDVSIGLQSGVISFPVVIIVELAFRWSRRFMKNFTDKESSVETTTSKSYFADLLADSDVPEEGSQYSKKPSWNCRETNSSVKYSGSDTTAITTKSRRKRKRVYGGKMGVRRTPYAQSRKSKPRLCTSSTEETTGNTDTSELRGHGAAGTRGTNGDIHTNIVRGTTGAKDGRQGTISTKVVRVTRKYSGTVGKRGTKRSSATGVRGTQGLQGTRGADGVKRFQNQMDVSANSSGSNGATDIVDNNEGSVDSWIHNGFDVELFKRLDWNLTMCPRMQSSDSMEHLSWINEITKRPFPSTGLFSSLKDEELLLKSDVDPTERQIMVSSVIYHMTWTFVCLAAATSSGVCIWVGAEYGIEMCKEWLVSVLCGVLETIFVLETFKVLLFAFISVCLKREVDIKDWFSADLEPAVLRDDKHSLSKQLLLDEERSRNSVYRPPTVKLIREGEEARNRERQVKRRIKTVAIHIVYLTLLLGASFGQRGKDLFDFGRAVESMLQGDLGQIAARDDIYSWIDVSLGDIFVGGHVRYFTDEQFLLIATPRLRQKRVVKGTTCKHAGSIKHWKLGNQKCEVDFDTTSEDKMSYKQDWNQPLTSNEPADTSNIWRYKFESSSWLSDYIGEFALYDPGGYYVDLPKNKSAVTKFTAALRRRKWIDQHTRLVMFETVAYNVAHRTYCVISLAIEINNIGSVYTRSVVSLMRSHHIQSPSDVIATLCLYGILIMVFYHLVEIASKVTERRWAFFHSLWNCLHVTTLMTSVAAVVTFLSRASYTDHALQAHFTDSDSFQLFRMAAQLDYVTRCLLSCCVFLTMAYTIKIMGGHHQFQLLHTTLRRAQTEVYGHLMYILFLYCAFCHVGLILFSETADFGSSLRTMQSVLAYSMEAFTSTSLLENYPIQGWYYLLVFFALFNKLFVNFYATILENCYRESKLLLRDEITTDNVISFGRKQLRSLFTIKDQRMKEMKNRKPEKYEQMIAGIMDGTAVVGNTHMPQNKAKSIG